MTKNASKPGDRPSRAIPDILRCVIEGRSIGGKAARDEVVARLAVAILRLHNSSVSPLRRLPQDTDAHQLAEEIVDRLAKWTSPWGLREHALRDTKTAPTSYGTQPR